MKALVTGAGGFVGQWLCRALVRGGWTVTGTTLGASPAPGILSTGELKAIEWRSVDLRPGVDRRSLSSLLDRAAPTAIFHLAGVAFVPAAMDDPMRAMDTNVGALVRLLAGVRERREAGTLDPAVLVVGSAEQYGRHEPAEMPLTEESPLRPRTFYAATKCAQETFALTAHRHDGTRIVATRSFNHSGRGQAPNFLLPALVERAREALRAPGAPLPIGNTDTVRDFLHVEDVVRAYILLAERGRAGEVYNVCSGIGRSVGEVASAVLAQAGATGPLTPDPTLQRSVDVPVLVGDHTKLSADTGWKPERPLSAIIDDLLNAAP